MHSRKVFVYTDVNYGASKASATQNTAGNPADLAVGSVGIYGIHEAAGVNLNRIALITDGGAETLGFVPMASFIGKEVVVAMGTATGHQLSNPIQVKAGLKETAAQIYTAPVRGALRIGFNGTVGTDFNTPATILRGDSFQIDLFNRNYFVAGGREPGQKVNLAITAQAGDSDYVLARKWIAALNLRVDDVLIDKALAKILHNGTGAVFTTAATVAGVNGATTLTASAAHGITAGDAISLNGDYYLTIAGTTGTTIVLDRPYQQATATIVNANTLDITGAATSWGLELVDGKDFYNIEGAVQGVIIDATIKRQTLPLPGSGSQVAVANMELEARPKKGTEDMTTSYLPRDVVRSVGTYDLYIMTVDNDRFPDGDQGSVFKVINYLTLAFPSGIADTANKNQSDFEDIMTTLFTTFPAISA